MHTQTKVVKSYHKKKKVKHFDFESSVDFLNFYRIFELSVDFFNHILHTLKLSKNCILTHLISNTKQATHLPLNKLGEEKTLNFDLKVLLFIPDPISHRIYSLSSSFCQDLSPMLMEIATTEVCGPWELYQKLSPSSPLFAPTFGYNLQILKVLTL